MKCPEDGTELVSLERSGIRVENCPRCHGAWLVHGELEKLISHALGNMEGFVERGRKLDEEDYGHP
jgi:Zn-finger nucleic acid-binding protein